MTLNTRTHFTKLEYSLLHFLTVLHSLFSENWLAYSLYVNPLAEQNKLFGNIACFFALFIKNPFNIYSSYLHYNTVKQTTNFGFMNKSGSVYFIDQVILTTEHIVKMSCQRNFKLKCKALHTRSKTEFLCQVYMSGWSKRHKSNKFMSSLLNYSK